jgi:hypothetical protein
MLLNRMILLGSCGFPDRPETAWHRSGKPCFHGPPFPPVGPLCHIRPFAVAAGSHYLVGMRTLSLRRLVGLLALLVFALALPMQASMGAPMADCSAAHAAMDMGHGDGASDCGKSGVPLKAAMGSICVSVSCATIAAPAIQAGTPVERGPVVHVAVLAQLRVGRVTAPDPFPPRPTVHA